MTEVCLVGADDADLRADLLSYETARAALSTYALREPYANALAVDTISLGAAVSLLNDLEWYLVRLTRDAMVREPSVSETEWLSRSLAAAVRDGHLAPEETDRFYKVYEVREGALVDPTFVTGSDRAGAEGTVAVRVTESEFG